MNVYIGFDNSIGPEEGAVLIFAPTGKSARKTGWELMKQLHSTKWTDMSVLKMRRNLTVLLRDADKDKLAEGIPHATANVTVCKNCGMFGEDGPFEDGTCGYCQ